MKPCISNYYICAKESCVPYESRTIFIRISWNIFTKPRRITRQVLIKTSVASALIAVLAFLVIYTAIIIASSSQNAAIYEDGGEKENLEGHKRVKLLWSAKGRSRFQSRYTPEMESRSRTLPSRDWGYSTLVKQSVVQPSCFPSLLLIAMVTSAPEHRERRDVIRKTWCSKTDSNLEKRRQCVFLIGGTKAPGHNSAVLKEAREHNDILVGNYSDSYRNLTYKVVAGFHWTVNECKPQFILKTDDDCFVNMKTLIRFLSLHPEKDVSQLYVGNVFMEEKELKVIRDSRSKWGLSYEDYAPEFYPKYASGTGYLVSNQVAKDLLQHSETYQPFPNEDAYIGVLAESLGFKPIHSSRFTLINSHWKMCNFLYLFVVHRISPERQYELTSLADAAQEKCGNQRFLDKWG